MRHTAVATFLPGTALILGAVVCSALEYHTGNIRSAYCTCFGKRSSSTAEVWNRQRIFGVLCLDGNRPAVLHLRARETRGLCHSGTAGRSAD
jgi:hypothetical protein